MAFKNNLEHSVFGQFGSILHINDDSILDSGITVDGVLAARGAVFVAITFLEESTFAAGNTTGLVSEDNTLYPNSATGSTAIDINGGSPTDSVAFPVGLTIYGRWTQIDLASGSCIAYIGY